MCKHFRGIRRDKSDFNASAKHNSLYMNDMIHQLLKLNSIDQVGMSPEDKSVR
jgi:hypothetical protein